MELTSTLLIDDNVVFRSIARTFLEQQEHLVVVGEASGGQQAITKAKHLQPRLILIDVIMPNQNGLETILKLRTLLPDSTIVATSLYADDGYRIAALGAGANAFIAKDTLATELVPVIKRLMRSETS